MKIKVKGSNLEMLDIEVNEEQVQDMWNTNTEQLEQIKQLTKDLENKISSYKYKEEECTRLYKEMNEANTLLTMLNIPTKTNEEERYSQTTLTIATRIALYIAGKLNA